jgi:hypothetical protein
MKGLRRELRDDRAELRSDWRASGRVHAPHVFGNRRAGASAGSSMLAGGAEGAGAPSASARAGSQKHRPPASGMLERTGGGERYGQQSGGGGAMIVEQRAAGATPPHDRAKILIVDDDSEMREHLGELLSDRWEIEQASDGLAALDSLCSHLPLWVKASRTQLDETILQLALNARDAMPAGGTLTIAVERVAIDGAATRDQRLPGPGEYARLTVTDTGCGIRAVLDRRRKPVPTGQRSWAATGECGPRPG